MTACNKFKYVLLAGAFLCFGCNAGQNVARVAAQEANQFQNQNQNQASGQNGKSGTVIGPANVPYQIDDAQIIQAQSQQARKVELTVTAPINYD